MLSSDVLIICFVFVHRVRYKLFDKRIRPWELPMLFLNEKIKNKSKWPWFSNRSPTAEFQHNSLHTLLFFYWGEGQTTTPRKPRPLLSNLTFRRCSDKGSTFSLVMKTSCGDPWYRTPFSRAGTHSCSTEPQTLPSTHPFTHLFIHSLIHSDSPDDIVHYGLARRHKNDTKVRAARAAQLFFHIEPIKSLVCGIVFAVAVVVKGPQATTTKDTTTTNCKHFSPSGP